MIPVKVRHPEMKRHPIVVVVLLAVVLAALTPAMLSAQQNSDPAQYRRQMGAGSDDTNPQPPDIRAGRLMGRSIQNRQGDEIAVIDDVILGRNGCIQKIIVSVGGFFGVADKLVAVGFDELRFESHWNYRTIRTQDGTEQKVAWEPKEVVTFEGDEKDLLQKPGYTYEESHPRGGPTGWGVYSYPAGPKTLKEVP